MPFIRSALAVVALACADPTAVTESTATEVAVAPASATLTSSFSIGARTVYVRLARPRSGAAESVNTFMRRMFASADSAGAERLAVDLRGVTGSDARLVVPLIRGILTRPRFARSGGLYVIVGDQSFAPSQSAATLLRRYAKPIFAADFPAR
jgi:hypothetical protein